MRVPRGRQFGWIVVGSLSCVLVFQYMVLLPRLSATTPRPYKPTAVANTRCPDARTCPDYLILGVGWRPDRRGQIIIHYRINPTVPHTSHLTSAQVIRAIRAAASAWNHADPRVHLQYAGTTTRVPGPPGDRDPSLHHNNVVGFAALAERGYTDIGHGPGGFYHGFYSSFDIRLSNALPWTWQPCDPAYGRPCTQYRTMNGVAAGPDLQDVATHEFGHVVGLEDLWSARADEQTEWAFSGSNRLCSQLAGCRARDTLALGDILGLRHLYPTRAPLPVIYRP